MPKENDEIYPDLANYMSVVAASHPDLDNRQFVVVSFEAGEGEISQLAFERDDAEQLVGGLVEALAGHHSPVGVMLLNVLTEAARADDDNEETDERPDGSAEDTDEEEACEGRIGLVIDANDNDGDDFAHEA